MENMNSGGGLIGIVLFVVWAAVALFMIASTWKLFTKAGQPGWACLVPIYNLIVMLKIAGKPAWWFVLFLIPGVNLVVMIMTAVALAKAFNKGTGFALGLIFLGFIFVPVLGFGSARYAGAPA